MSSQFRSGEAATVSVVVPVFNGALSIRELVDRLLAVASDANIIEIILVDDASPDDSWAVISSLAEESDHVLGVGLTRNYGQHAALLAGIEIASGDLIVTMDDDLQHRPEDVPTLVAAIAGGADLAYGCSVVEEHGAFRNLTSRGAKGAIAAAAGSEIASMASGFRCFVARDKAILIQPRGPYISLDVLLSWVCRTVVAVPVTMDQRRYGQSNYTFKRLVRHAFNMLFGFSTAPLRLVSYAGVAVGFMGALLLAFVIVRYFAAGSTVPGFAFLASMVALFSGVQLLALGVIGEYLARMYAGSLRRPAYVVRVIIGRGRGRS